MSSTHQDRLLRRNRGVFRLVKDAQLVTGEFGKFRLLVSGFSVGQSGPGNLGRDFGSCCGSSKGMEGKRENRLGLEFSGEDIRQLKRLGRWRTMVCSFLSTNAFGISERWRGGDI